MNRGIKFRGFSKKLNSWVYGFFQEVDVEGIGYSYIFWQGNTTFVEANSVGQFTNLYDKNDKEIYEGDVLQTRSGIGYMVFDNCGYAIKSPGSEAVDYEFSAFYLECEIIGNIYENPELIS